MPGFTYDQFGRIFYVSLRGIAAATPSVKASTNGENFPAYEIFFDRPEEQFIAALSDFFQPSP